VWLVMGGARDAPGSTRVCRGIRVDSFEMCSVVVVALLPRDEPAADIVSWQISIFYVLMIMFAPLSCNDTQIQMHQ
jgi:hypothetical protein